MIFQRFVQTTVDQSLWLVHELLESYKLMVFSGHIVVASPHNNVPLLFVKGILVDASQMEA